MKILICSIIRNQFTNLENWYSQISELIYECPDHQFSLSVFENDSADGTKDWLADCHNNWDKIPTSIMKLDSFRLVSENIGTVQYSSVWSIDRIMNLAMYRNRCLDGLDLSRFDKIVYIEPDVTYDPIWCSELINARHPMQAGISPDIYSGWSLRTEKHPKESMFLYDTCATRQNAIANCWNFDTENKYRSLSLIPTSLSNYDSNCLHRVWSTFSCFCVYNAKPFHQGLRWNYINRRLDTGQPKIENGWLDADTVVICEDFRDMGFTNIMYNTNCLIRHLS